MLESVEEITVRVQAFSSSSLLNILFWSRSSCLRQLFSVCDRGGSAARVFMRSSNLARCAGVILASISGGIGGAPLIEIRLVASQRPSLRLSGLGLSAAQRLSLIHI